MERLLESVNSVGSRCGGRPWIGAGALTGSPHTGDTMESVSGAEQLADQGLGCVLGDECAYVVFKEFVTEIIKEMDLCRPSAGYKRITSGAGSWGQLGRVDVAPMHLTSAFSRSHL